MEEGGRREFQTILKNLVVRSVVFAAVEDVVEGCRVGFGLDRSDIEEGAVRIAFAERIGPAGCAGG